MAELSDRDVTPPELYFNRRAFLKTGVIAATAVGTGLLYRRLNGLPPQTQQQAALVGLKAAADNPDFHVDDPMTPFQTVTTYNNFYEFSTAKAGVAPLVGGFKTDGWKITVDGLCDKPASFNLDDLGKISPPEQRVYRMRCVEAWSMVIPWAGFSLSKLLDRVQPQSGAKYVAFTSVLDPQHMPGQKDDVLQWPYVEGLRMDEAMHPLTLLTTGLYGNKLPVQDGAPVRIIVPWKYGFKGIKSIVKISLVADMPPTSWNRFAPGEYGFYANVNPEVDHPRWSQADEQRIGDNGRRPTLMFNGYGDEVAGLYTGMDLKKFY